MKKKKKKNKNNNKNKTIIICTIAVLCICVILIILQNNKDKTNNGWELLYNIKSTKKNPIKQGNIEVINIDIVQRNGQEKVIFTIKNNGQEKQEGTFLVFELLDENKNKVATIADNIPDTISPKEKKTYEVYITLSNEDKIIKYAQIEGGNTQ